MRPSANRRGPLIFLLVVLPVCALPALFLYHTSFLDVDDEYLLAIPTDTWTTPGQGHVTRGQEEPPKDWREEHREEQVPDLPDLRALYSKSDRVAIIVVPKPDLRLAETVHNAMANLPFEWKVQIFHSPEVTDFVTGFQSLKRYEKIGRLFFTPTIDYNMSYVDFSLLLKSIKFWDQVQGEYVLTIQTDAVMCSNSPYSVNDFLQYDWVGAPWRMWPHLLGGNGGLSLRRKSKLIETIQKCKLPTPRVEDMWFSYCFLDLAKGHNYTVKLAPQHISKHFAVETIYSSTPLGIHKPWPYLKREEMKQLFKFCPELHSVAPEGAICSSKKT